MTQKIRNIGKLTLIIVSVTFQLKIKKFKKVLCKTKNTTCHQCYLKSQSGKETRKYSLTFFSVSKLGKKSTIFTGSTLKYGTKLQL